MSDATPLRVMTYNVHRCVGRGGTDSFDAVADLCAASSADLIALQELDAPTTDDGDGVHHARDLAARLGMRYLMLRTFRRLADRDYGHALLSRHPIRAPPGRPVRGAGRGHVGAARRDLGPGHARPRPGHRRHQHPPRHRPPPAPARGRRAGRRRLARPRRARPDPRPVRRPQRAAPVGDLPAADRLAPGRPAPAPRPPPRHVPEPPAGRPDRPRPGLVRPRRPGRGRPALAGGAPGLGPPPADRRPRASISRSYLSPPAAVRAVHTGRENCAGRHGSSAHVRSAVDDRVRKCLGITRGGVEW